MAGAGSVFVVITKARGVPFLWKRGGQEQNSSSQTLEEATPTPLYAAVQKECNPTSLFAVTSIPPGPTRAKGRRTPAVSGLGAGNPLWNQLRTRCSLRSLGAAAACLVTWRQAPHHQAGVSLLRSQRVTEPQLLGVRKLLKAQRRGLLKITFCRNKLHPLSLSSKLGSFLILI